MAKIVTTFSGSNLFKMNDLTSVEFKKTVTTLFQSNPDVDSVVRSTKGLIQMGRDDFVNLLTSNIKEENKAEISKLRIKLGNHVIKTLKINPAPKIMNRSKLELMFADIWYFALSLEENCIQAECNEIFKGVKNTSNTLNESQLLNSSMNSNETNSQLEKKIDRILNELIQTKEKLLSELYEVKSVNSQIIDELKALRNENGQLKKIISEQGKFKNFNFYNNLNDADVDNECVIMNDKTITNNNEANTFKVPGWQSAGPSKGQSKTSYANVGQKSKNGQDKFNVRKKNVVVGAALSSDLKGADKLYEFYCGFWSTNADKESVSEYINKFARVSKIEELTVKHSHYKSFHVSVSSKYNDLMLDANNWPSGVRVKRFFFSSGKRSNDQNGLKSTQKEQNSKYDGGYRKLNRQYYVNNKSSVLNTPSIQRQKRSYSPDEKDMENEAKIANNEESESEEDIMQTNTQ